MSIMLAVKCPFDSTKVHTPVYRNKQCTNKSLCKALFERSPDTLPMIARRSIRENFEAEKETILNQCKDALLGATVKLIADYDAIWKTIVAGKKVHLSRLPSIHLTIFIQVNKEVDPQDKARSFGNAVKGYFEGFAYQMKSKLVSCPQ